MGLGIPPLRIKIPLASNPPKSRTLWCGDWGLVPSDRAGAGDGERGPDRHAEEPHGLHDRLSPEEGPGPIYIYIYIYIYTHT